MKKVDLHLHTIATQSDVANTFSLAKLEEYVRTAEVDCIAITNHNLFDLNQFSQIAAALAITVLPGIEIDLESGHLLLISDGSNLADFEGRCGQVKALIPTKDDCITVEQLKMIFPNLGTYILIPHYEKTPAIPHGVIQVLRDYMTCGEVTSVKKFKACANEEQKLVPVLFSDQRFHDQMTSFSSRQTYLQLETISFTGIKACLADKTKVSLSKTGGNSLFEPATGLTLSTGLNVVLGERSSGKTFTLEKIFAEVGKENVMYIKQFDLISNDEAHFNKTMKTRKAKVSEQYLKELKEVVDDIISIDRAENDLKLEAFVDTLLSYAEEHAIEDIYSKASLFSESLFPGSNLEQLKKLIEGVMLLLDNTEHRDLISKHLPENALIDLLHELIQRYTMQSELDLKKKWVNTLVSEVKKDLSLKTTRTPPQDVDFFQLLRDETKIHVFTKVVTGLRQNRRIYSEEIGHFKVVAETRPYTGASQLNLLSKRQGAFTPAFQKYNNPYQYLQELKLVDIASTTLHEYFVEIDYNTLNRHGFKVSGGERSEFNLLNEIADALKYDLLLIDEPESSFDNLFLKNEVNKLIKSISTQIPVIVVTHNNTVGASIQPDYLLFTQKTVDPSGIKHRVFSGYPWDKQLSTSDGEKIDNYQITLDCLEAGQESYHNRRTQSYEILQN